MTTETNHSLALLRDALTEAQMTVRAYDTKAQIVGVGYIFALGVITRFENLFDKSADLNLLRVAAAWFIVILPIVLFGYVLYPSRRVAPRLDEEERAGIDHVLYVIPGRQHSIAQLKDAAARCDPHNEVAYELLKVSMLRDMKRMRFLRALFAAGASFLLIFGTQIIRSL